MSDPAPVILFTCPPRTLWYRCKDWFICITVEQGRYTAKIYPDHLWYLSPCEINSSELAYGTSVLGAYPTEQAALDAAQFLIAMRDEPRIACLADIDRARDAGRGGV